MFSSFSGRYQEKALLGHIENSTPSFLRNLHTVFHSGCTSLRCPQQWMRVSSSPQLLQHLLLLVLLITAILIGVRWYHMVALICISLIINEFEYLFIYQYLFVIYISLWERCLFSSSAHFSIGLFVGVEFYKSFKHWIWDLHWSSCLQISHIWLLSFLFCCQFLLLCRSFFSLL